ncbi:MAG: VOC family protein [Frankia sp.]|nr:VOC family protein [Frankia sp.]
MAELYFGSVVINVGDMDRARRFWTATLGYVERDAPDETFTVLHDPQRPWANLSLQLTSEPKSQRNRLHLDLYTEHQQREVERLIALGATRPAWDYPPDADFVVLADPDGNEFCVIQR